MYEEGGSTEGVAGSSLRGLSTCAHHPLAPALVSFLNTLYTMHLRASHVPLSCVLWTVRSHWR